MKWMKSFTMYRHGESEYNILKNLKANDSEYQLFKSAFEHDHRSDTTWQLAESVSKKFKLNKSDYETGLTKIGKEQAVITGKNSPEHVPLPDIIFYSPFVRTHDTLENMCIGWPELNNVEKIAEDRIREQEHGLALLYSDWRLFHTYYPEQKALHDLLGPYWYQYPQGESVSQVRDRVRDFFSMLIRECADMNVMCITHHLTTLSIRANLERLTPEDFIWLDDNDKPVNCGITQYIGNPKVGKNGKLELTYYNKKLYEG